MLLFGRLILSLLELEKPAVREGAGMIFKTDVTYRTDVTSRLLGHRNSPGVYKPCYTKKQTHTALSLIAS